MVDPTEPGTPAALAAAATTDADADDTLGGAETLADGVAGQRRAELSSTKIGRFDLRSKLGEGGMGIVYEAYDAQLDRMVAIKLVRASDGGTQGHARLLREAQAMAKVAHPNVVSIYEVGEHGDQVFVAMELVAGETLSAWQRRGEHDWRETLAMYVATGRGLAAAHARGIVHRDFKPDNVLVGSDRRPRVLDFGLARAVAAPSAIADADGSPTAPTAPSDGSILAAELTVAGSVMGTPAYMSPEHWAGDPIGPAGDQFGFAVALYRALFGTPPFANDTIADLRTAVCLGELRPPRADPDVPPAIVAALVRALALSPDARFPSMDALLATLEQPLLVDPALDPARGSRGRRIAAAILGAGGLASVISTSARTELDRTAGLIVIQSAVAVATLAVLAFVLRKSLLTSEHNRRIGIAVIAIGVGALVHRVLAYLLGAPPIDTLVGDAVMLGVVTVIAGVAFERWMLWGVAIVAVYLGVALALPALAGPCFGAMVLVLSAGAAWRWGLTTRART